jgi:hypothetical protein
MILVLGSFITIIGLMPSEFYAVQPGISTNVGQDKLVVDYFDAHNITLYKSTWAFNITWDEEVHLDDVPVTNERLTASWNYYSAADSGMFPGPDRALTVSHDGWFSFLGLFGWWTGHRLILDEPYLTLSGGRDFAAQGYMTRTMLLNLATDANSAYYELSCIHVPMKFVVLNWNSSWNLEQSWDNQHLRVLGSYDIDWDAMKPSAWNLLTSLITFQNPALGIPGDFGSILTYVIGLAFWTTTAIIIYTVVTRLFPTIQGGIED